MNKSIISTSRSTLCSLRGQMSGTRLHGVYLFLVTLLWLVGCIESQSHVCRSGFRCPPKHICIEATEECVPGDAVDECVGKPEGALCSYPALPHGGICTAGYCASQCGNGEIQTQLGEICDPGVQEPTYCIYDDAFDMGVMGCSDTCLSQDTSTCTTFGWQPVESLADRSNWQIARVLALAADNIWAVGYVGPKENLQIEDILAYQGTGRVFHYDGQRWSSINLSAETFFLTAIWSDAPNNIYVASVIGSIWHYDGVAWHRVVSGPAIIPGSSNFYGITSMHVRSPGDIILSSIKYNNYENGGAILRYHEQAWDAMFTVNEDELWKVGGRADDLFAVGTRGTMLRYNNEAGGIWEQVDAGTETDLIDVWVTDSNNAFAAGEDIIIRYDGNPDGAWEQMVLDAHAGTLLSIWCANRYDCHAVGSNKGIGRVFHYDGNTDNRWRSEPSRSDQPLLGVHGSAGDNVIAAGLNGVVLRKQSGWVPAAEPKGLELFDLWGHGSDCYFGVGRGGKAMMRRGAGGWSMIPDDPEMSFHGVSGLDCSRIFAAGVMYDKGVLRKYENGSWRAIEIPQFEEIGGDVPKLYDIWVDYQNNVYMVGSDGVVLRYQEPDNWQISRISGDPGLRTVWGTSRSLYVAGLDGKVFCRDLSSTWSDSTQPDSWIDVSLPDHVGNIDALWGSDDDHVYAASPPGLLLSYDGNCKIPEVEYTGVSAGPTDIWGRAPDDIYMATDRGDIVHYDGVVWAPMRSPTGREIRALWGDPDGDLLILASKHTIDKKLDGQLYEFHLNPE